MGFYIKRNIIEAQPMFERAFYKTYKNYDPCDIDCDLIGQPGYHIRMLDRFGDQCDCWLSKSYFEMGYYQI